jgi:hypothetical protein
MAVETASEAAAQLASDAATLAAEVQQADDSTEEDYRWLTERLDALANRQQALEQMMVSLPSQFPSNEPSPEMVTAMDSLAQQNRTLTDLLTATQQQLTNLQETVLSRLTPNSSTHSLPAAGTEQTGEPTAANPDNGVDEQTQEQRVEDAQERRRRRRI